MDWQALGARIGPYLTAAIGAATIACVLFVVRLRRTARSTAFGYVREQAVKNARRIAVLIAVLGLLGALSAALWVVSVRNPALLPTPVPTATPTVIPSPTPRTPTATFTPTSTPTPTPVHTSTPIPPSSEMPGLLQTPFPSHAVAPGPGAALVDVVLASGQVDNQPLNPTNRFPSGTAQVYAFLTFDGMSANVPWAHVWYGEVDGQMVEVWGVVEMWSYASARGQVWRYLNARDGRYELHVYVDRQLQQKVPFTVGGE